MKKLDSNDEDQIRIKTLCEFLFSDQFEETATFNRFELCFQPLFNNIDISLDKVFKYICGKKKKYITYKRFAKAYLEFKNGRCQSKDAETFFKILIYNILQLDGYIGILRENQKLEDKSEDGLRENLNKFLYFFSNKRTCQKSDCISKLQIICDDEENIHGIYLEYNEVHESKMYPEKFKDELIVRLEIHLNIIDEELIEENMYEFSSIKQGDYRDAITHIYGTINEETNYITFLGFKCISGKTLFVGKPKGKGFLFGKFGSKFHYLSLQLKNDGITYLEPGFKENIRSNYYLDKIFGRFSEQDLEENEIIKEEDFFDKINDENEIDQLITTPLIPEDLLNKNNLKEEISGNDYKEVVDQSPRKWILNSIIIKNDDKKLDKSLSLNSALKLYDEMTKINLNSSINKSYYSIISNNYNPMISSDNLKSIEKMELPFIPNPFAYEGQKDEYSDDIVENLEKKEIILPRKAKIYKPGIKESILANGTRIKITKEKWDGDINKSINPNIFLNKENYQQLMDKIKQNILEDYETCNEEDKKMINETFNKPGQKTVIISNTKKCYMNIQKIQTQIKMKNNKIEELLNKEKIIPKKVSSDELYQLNPNKYQSAQEKWQFFRKKIEKTSGIFLLQTIGCIIKAKLLFQNKIFVPKQEQLKLYQILQENRTIIDFLNSDKDEEEKDDLYYIKTTILIPNKHPEKITSLDVLQKQLDDIKNLLKDKNLNEKDRLKLEKLSELYLKQKNILIENETENIKKGGGKGFIKEIFKNLKKYLDKEKVKIRKAKEEEKKKKKELILKNKKIEQEKRQTILRFRKKVNIISSEKVFKNQKISQNCEIWTDNQFSPNRKSLCPYDDKGNWIIPEYGRPAYLRGWKNIVWSRINEIKKLDHCDVFYDGATIDDIKQGGIGDCYFLSAIGSLSNFPNFIESHFYLDNENKHIYGIYFFINGRWKRVLVDDYFPCIMNKKNPFGELYFSCSFQNELWVSLIEKAWAKINGSYANIDYGGYSYEAFDILTEACSEHIEIGVKGKEKIWEILMNSMKRNYLMTVASKSFGFFSALRYMMVMGIEERHAYTVIKVKVIEPNKGEKVRLVQLRNPYGEKEYTGDWGKCSTKWTPELKKKYNYHEEIEKYDGMFYMSFDDFCNCFEILDICKIEKDYQTIYCKIKKNQANKCQVLELEVDKEYPRTFIQLYKKNLRIVKNNNFHHKYNVDNNIMGFIVLAKIYEENGETKLKYIKSIAGYETHLAIEADLTQGTYFIFCDVNYRYNDQKYGYAITCYHKSSGKKLKLNNITESVDSKKLLEITIGDYCLNYHKSKQVILDKGIKIYKKDNINGNNKKFPFDILCFHNCTNKTVKIKIEIKKGKSFCIYNDRVCCENRASVTKEIRSQRVNCILVMRYNKESTFDIIYQIL